ncbi:MULTISPECIES: hypothetical protein [Burkholderia]|uniref:Uncharacterized protein n=1 Tax=Burkholderia anthinoferrum TaxID=3090833 RepID=A0ABU5WWJ5_9BURK|nr:MULTISPECIES: hypothetical protein [Burkholderia]MEB2507325.1 hypothetical protein [Burkholderia anthinoferrum]MEB2535964.1 hypothetical protein [Burkholderia anthinoferrum]MEB2565164.1 hypothetical protein [Burkholderia anthinoferrum]MEB2583155.1 hypothetical protein [Burkholderia anthinoferrum]MBR8348678.1 hypothetical protein [Burkholderia ambifaria]
MPNLDDVRWTFCLADIESAGNALRVRAFLRDVVEPALAALDADIDRWANITEGGAPFAHQDAKELLRSTTEAFCLAIHSLFERQIRRWLAGCVCAFAHSKERIERAQNGNLNVMSILLKEVRGIPLSTFDSYADLQRLQLLANACRHGDGDSASRLFKRHPELWQDWPPMPMILPGQAEPYVYGGSPTFDRIVVPRQWLRDFVDAVAWFWEDVEIVHCNSLNGPNPSASHRLAALHQARAARRKPELHPT